MYESTYVILCSADAFLAKADAYGDFIVTCLLPFNWSLSQFLYS